jgi:beta-aspartyl-peptidase (threonine type)
MQIAIVVHGGAGNSADNRDGCEAAASRGFAALRGGGDALGAAVEAAVVLEDDPRFNAGNGSIVRSDGSTVEMDASVMDSRGRLGAVCALRGLRNPVRIAREVANGPHWMLAGSGAAAFGRTLSPANDASSPVAAHAGDTIGAVTLDAAGHFAVASSTGGSAPALVGRVGDTPIPGCGFWAGSAGAIGATGVGEHIVRALLARRVYEWLEAGAPLAEALERGIALIAPDIEVGLIGVTRNDAAARSNSGMPFAVMRDE